MAAGLRHTVAQYGPTCRVNHIAGRTKHGMSGLVNRWMHQLFGDSMRLTDTELLEMFEGMFSDGEGDIRCYARNVVAKTRISHACSGLTVEDHHVIPAGSRAVRETCIMDGRRVAAYTCEAHVLAWGVESGQLARVNT